MTIFQWHTILHVRKKLSKASGAVLLLKPYVLGRNINMRQVRGAKHRQANYISKSDPEGPGMCGDSRRGTNKPEVFSIGQGTTARIGPSTESFPRERLWGGGARWAHTGHDGVQLVDPERGGQGASQRRQKGGPLRLRDHPRGLQSGLKHRIAVVYQ